MAREESADMGLGLGSEDRRWKMRGEGEGGEEDHCVE